MMKIIIFLLVILSCSAYATDIIFTDIFPACGAESDGSSDMLRCGAEFLVPNFHLGMLGNMITKMVTSLLLIDEIYKFFGNPAGYVVDVVAGTFDMLQSILNLDDADGGVSSVVWKLMKSVMGYVWGLLAPIAVILIITAMEFIKTYLEIAIPLMLWLTAISEYGISMKSNKGAAGIALAAVVCMFFGTLFLLSLDMNIFTYLVRW